MDLSQYDQKYVLLTDKFGERYTGLASYGGADFLMCEYGGEEDGLFIGDCLIYRSLITAIEEIEMHGTAEMWAGRMLLRRYRAEDAQPLCERLGRDPEQSRYSGWNPYATPDMARETVNGFLARYDDPHCYAWVMDIDDVLVGTIGAYDLQDGRIEVGFSVVRAWQGRGLATEALKKVLEYLTENEQIACVTAWCAADNIGSRRVLEKAGMHLTHQESEGLRVGQTVYDRLVYEYRPEP